MTYGHWGHSIFAYTQFVEMSTDGVGVQIGRKLAKTLCWLRSVVSELFYFDCEKASQIFNQFISNVVMITFFVCADLLFPVRLLAIPNNHGDAVTTHRIDLPVNKRVVSHCPSFCFPFGAPSCLFPYWKHCPCILCLFLFILVFFFTLFACRSSGCRLFSSFLLTFGPVTVSHTCVVAEPSVSRVEMGGW